MADRKPRAFYAEHNRYGIGTTTTIRRNGHDKIVSAGDLYRFPTAAARDAFVAEASDIRTREALTAPEARRFHGIENMAATVWEDANHAKMFTEPAGYDVLIETKRPW